MVLPKSVVQWIKWLTLSEGHMTVPGPSQTLGGWLLPLVLCLS